MGGGGGSSLPYEMQPVENSWTVTRLQQSETDLYPCFGLNNVTFIFASLHITKMQCCLI
jgi:hypothetical protein